MENSRDIRSKFRASENSDFTNKIITAKQNDKLQQLCINKNCSFNANLFIYDKIFIFVMHINPIKAGLFLLSMSGGEGSIQPDTLAANNF